MKVKDFLEILEAICTIVVSVGAIWGSIIAWENGFLYKVKHLVDHYHAQLEIEEKSVIEKSLKDI